MLVTLALGRNNIVVLVMMKSMMIDSRHSLSSESD